MTQFLRGWIRAVVVGTGCLALATADARAVVVNFSTTSDGENINMTNGNTANVSISGGASMVDLAPGVAQTVTIHNAELSGLPLSPDAGSGTLSHTLSITGPAATPSSFVISQSVSAAYTQDSIFDPVTGSATIGGSTARVFNLGASGTLTVTPLGGSVLGASLDQPAAFTNSASFLLTAPVPEPVTLPLFAAAGGLLLRRGSRRRTA